MNLDPRRVSFALTLVACLAADVAGCAAADDPATGGLPAATAALSPNLAPDAGGKAAGQGDRACQVVLRSVQRAAGGPDYETDCTSGECRYVWRGVVDVAGTVPADAEVGVLYHVTGDPTWWEVPAIPDPAVSPGFRRHAVALSEHLFGPATADRDTLVIQVVAFVRLADGSRLFDHNRFPGDFDNARLARPGNFAFDAGDTCQPEVGHAWFNDNFTQGTSGFLRREGYLEVHYDIDRLPDCRGTHNGFPAWDVVAYARFAPGGQVVSGSVRQLGNVNGRPTNDATDLPFVTKVPSDATSVELWFRNASGAGSSCETWDSAFGQNYRFDVLPRADDPRCLGVEKESGAHTEDDRMAHNQPYCFPYDLDAQVDADHCEFFVDGLGDGYVGHYGIPFHWLVAYLKAGPQQGEVLNAGLFTRSHDAATGETTTRYSVGLPQADGAWRTGFAYQVTGFQSVQGCDLVVDEFAFFLDVRRPDGRVVRLWQSRHGANYRPGDAFTLPVYTENIPYGRIRWADPASTVFESRAACSR